tara:strand:- start:3642 stop:3827 length:186 start_codon:yes stop_codon:yes gene_type:complete
MAKIIVHAGDLLVREGNFNLFKLIFKYGKHWFDDEVNGFGHYFKPVFLHGLHFHELSSSRQ